MADLTREQRDALVKKIQKARDELSPERSGGVGLSLKIRNRLRDAYYVLLAEYADRLPRRLFGRCPFTGEVFLHSIDPFGVDGPWWHQDCVLDLQEPKVPPTFKIHLGAFALDGRQPIEASEQVIPGPDAPFVVPRLLRLPGMAAVVMQINLETGDRAWVITYWSRDDIPPVRLHQPWLRIDHWFKNDRGRSSWTIANDTWDYNLEPYVADGRLRWIDPADPLQRVVRASDGAKCPFLGIAGDHLPQVFAEGTRELQEPPDGTPINPFES